MKPWLDPNHRGNGSEHRTGRKCIEPGCDHPAGTWWSPLWCQPCNGKRIEQIDAQMKDLLAYAEGKA